jgi:hypothetical protein
MHRSLLFVLKALLFYFEKTNSPYSLNKIFSGYRCWTDNNDGSRHSDGKIRTSTNHMGCALDLHFNKNGNLIGKVEDMEKIREDFFCKYMNAPYEDGGQRYKFGWDDNRIGLEPKIMINGQGKEVSGAKSWVHVDVREFEDKYKYPKFFVKDAMGMNGKPIKEM